MSDPEEPAALAYIEKTLADFYRKEIDQEENVWRSLPFFAATLSLQLAALFQMIDKLPVLATVAGKVAIGFLSIAGLLTLVSLVFLAFSIYPRRFDYVASEPELLRYARDLIDEEQGLAGQEPGDQGRADPFSALVTLKTELARQYAKGADHNRQINKRRERLRSIAGLAALGSVSMTVFLVATAYTHYLMTYEERDDSHAAARIAATEPQAKRPGSDTVRPAFSPAGALPAADANRNQGVVDPSRGARDGGRARK